MINFIKSTFLLVGHYATFAEEDMLFDYLSENRVKTITRINFPLPELPYMERIKITINEQGIVKESKSISSFVRPIWLAYILQSFQLLFLIFRSRRTYDILIAQDSLLAFLGIIFRTFGKCKKVIFFSHGIDKQRFRNPVMNGFYRLLDSFSAKASDFNWFMSKNMIPVRRKQGIKDEKMFWIPSTVPIKSITRKKIGKPNTIVFLGTIDEKNGAQLLPDIVAQVKQNIPEVTFDVMGNGPLFKKVSQEIKKLHLERKISLLGHLPLEKFSTKLTDYAVGIAPYAYSEKSLTPLSDSLKMRLYLAAGLPVVITKGYWFSDEIEENRLGFAVNQTVDDFARAIIKLLNDNELNQEIRGRALSYSKKLDLTGFYNRAFKIVLRTL
ncbi:MAG: glycosyltransferase [Candidatus Levyibacteriota bacterium]